MTTTGDLAADHVDPIDEWLSRGLGDCPRSAYIWAGRAYQYGYRDGRREVLKAIRDAGQSVAAAAGSTLKVPTWDVLQDRREPDFTPCPRRCRQCARCIASLAYWDRGGRPFLGVEREAELARGAA